MLEKEAVTRAKALHNPNIVGVKIVGLKTTKSIYAMLKTAASQNLVSIIHINMILGWLSYQTINKAIEPIAAIVLIAI